MRILSRPATAGLPRIRDMTQISSPEKRRPPVAHSQVLPVVGSQLAEHARRRFGLYYREVHPSRRSVCMWRGGHLVLQRTGWPEGNPPGRIKVDTRGFGEWFEPRFEITQKKSQGSLKTGKGRTGFEAAGKRKMTTWTSALNFHTLQAAGDSIRRADKPSCHLEPCQPWLVIL